MWPVITQNAATPRMPSRNPTCDFSGIILRSAFFSRLTQKPNSPCKTGAGLRLALCGAPNLRRAHYGELIAQTEIAAISLRARWWRGSRDFFWQVPFRFGLKALLNGQFLHVI